MRVRSSVWPAGSQTPHDETAVRGVLAEAAGALRDDLRPLARAGRRGGHGRRAGAATPTPTCAARCARSTQANLADVLALLGRPGAAARQRRAAGGARARDHRSCAAASTPATSCTPTSSARTSCGARGWRSSPSGSTGRAALIAALELSSARLFSRADFLVAQLMRHVDRERERWMGGALARRAQLVRDAARAATTPDVAEASRALGYDVDRWVLAAVLWDAGRPRIRRAARPARGAGGDRRARGRRAARAHARAGRGEPVGVGRHARPAGPRAGRRRRCDGALSRAPGRRARHARPGPGGLPARATRRRCTPRRIAELGERSGVVRYDEVEAVSLLSGDLDRLARFVAAHARPAHRATTRRPRGCARRCWPGWPRAGTRAAPPSALHAHKNTVLYRLQRAQQILGRPLDDDRGELELALTAMRSSARARGPPRPERAFVRAPQRRAGHFRPRARGSAPRGLPSRDRTEAAPPAGAASILLRRPRRIGCPALMASHHIVTLPGDGIGPEILAAATRVLDAVGDFTYDEHAFGGAAIDAHGTALTDETVAACRAADAVLLAAVGGPKWDSTDPDAPRPEQGLLGLRKALGLYANLRPVRPAAGALRRQPAQARADRGHRPARRARAHRRHLLRREDAHRRPTRPTCASTRVRRSSGSPAPRSAPRARA